MSDETGKIIRLHHTIGAKNATRQNSDKALGKFKRLMTELPHLFSGSLRVIKIWKPKENQPAEYNGKHVTLDSNVLEELEVMLSSCVKYANALVVNELTNQHSNADIIVNGKVLSSGLPGLFLVSFREVLNDWEKAIEQSLTRPAGKHWVPDPENAIRNAHKTKDPVLSDKTEKVVDVVRLFIPDKDDPHEPQVESRTTDKVIGTNLDWSWTGSLSEAEKRGVLDRIQMVRESIETAIDHSKDAVAVGTDVDWIGPIKQFILTGE